MIRISESTDPNYPIRVECFRDGVLVEVLEVKQLSVAVANRIYDTIGVQPIIQKRSKKNASE